MDAWFLVVMLGQFAGIPLLVLGVALAVPEKSRWFAAPVVFFAIVGAALITVTDTHMFIYTRWALFWGAFTLITVLLGGVSAAVALVVAVANASTRKKHAA